MEAGVEEPERDIAVAGESGADALGVFRRTLTRARLLWRELGMCLGLIVVTLIVYGPVRHHEFAGYDDPDYVTDNPHVFEGLTWRGVLWAFTTSQAANWHPVTWLSHMLDAELFGLQAGAHHLTSVLLHLANSLLLFGLLRALTGAVGRSAVVAALFAVHPLHVESVAWVAERKDVLSTLFGLLTLWGYVRYVRQPGPGRYLGLLVPFALGLMAKPMLVTLPFVLLLLDIWPLGRAPIGARGAAETRSGWGPLVWEKLPLFALAAASSLVTFAVQQHAGAVIPTAALPLTLRVANGLVAYVAYIGKMLWPTRLAAIYPLAPIPSWQVVAASAGLAGITAGALWAVRRRPYLAVGWLWYVGTLVPVIGLVQVGIQAMADRYTYIPLIGLFIMGAWGVPELLGRWPARRVALPLAAGVVIVAGTLAARAQVHHWKNSLTLFEHAVTVTTNNHIAQNNLGVALQGQGRFSEAMPRYAEALRIAPGYADAHTNMGVALQAQGNLSEALARYGEALRFQPRHAAARNNLAGILISQGKIDEGIAHLGEALRAKPNYADAHYNLGLALEQKGRVTEAIAHYADAVRFRPGYAAARHKLAAALDRQGRVTEAAAHYAEAVRFKPDSPEAHYNLGLVLAGQGRIAEAIAHYQEALRLKPDYPEAHNNLGNRLFAQGKSQEAIAHYQEALRLKPDHSEAHNNLGAALLAQGKIAEAMTHLSEALRLKPDYADAHSNLGAVLLHQGKIGESVAHLSEALQLNPESANSHYLLASALAKQQQIHTAIVHYRDALRRRPDWPEPLNDLAWILATHENVRIRNGAEAIKLATRACELTGYRQPAPLATLAAAYAEGGRFDEAAATADRAAALALSEGRKELALRISSQRELYGGKQPYRAVSQARATTPQ